MAGRNIYFENNKVLIIHYIHSLFNIKLNSRSIEGWNLRKAEYQFIISTDSQSTKHHVASFGRLRRY